ncbi:MAG: DUF2721 domain-containing protein [Nitrospirota bacterium]|nr:DUF2721 domain-containing protein [Nitrospirota bacterium]
MQNVDLAHLTAILQASISPVALISGVGLLLMSLTNRFGRLTDRARDLGRQARTATPAEMARLDDQIVIIYRRVDILRASISLAAASILCASVMIIALFAAYTFNAPLHYFTIGTFILGAVCLLASIILFIKDVGMSLKALRMDLGEHLTDRTGQRRSGQ